MTQPLKAYSHYLANHQMGAKTLPTVNEIAEIFNKYIALIRFPFYGVSTLYGILKHIPLNDNLKTLLDSQRDQVGSILSSLQIPRFFLNQIRFFKACADLRTCISGNATIAADQVLRKVKVVFLSAGSLTSSAIGLTLLFDKMKYIYLAHISKGLPLELVRGRNLITLGLASVEFIDSVSSFYKQIEKEHGRPPKSGELSQETWNELCNVSSKSLTLTSQLAKTAALFFCVNVHPVALTAISTASFGLALKKYIESNREMFWGSRSCIQIKSSTQLPA